MLLKFLIGAMLLLSLLGLITVLAAEAEGTELTTVSYPGTVDVLSTEEPEEGEERGSTSADRSLGWVIAGLAGAGLAAIAGFGALRLRTRRG